MSHGVIAAGHHDTARAGADVLAAGGNAVDAAVAAAFAACVAEPFLIGLGSGGFMLVHDHDSRSQTLFDFFIAMPGREMPEQHQTTELIPAPVDFGETVQMFQAGHASVGVPGFVAGIVTAHQKLGRLPLAELIKPAKELAKRGVTITKQQEYLVDILSHIMKLSPDAEKLFFRDGQPLREGEVFRHPEIASSLDEIAKHGAESFYRGDLAEAIIEEFAAGGGYLTPADLAGYEVLERKPVRALYRDHTLVSNPPPSSGGPLIAHTLSLLAGFNLASFGRHSYEHVRHLVEAMITTGEVRKNQFDHQLHNEDVMEQLLAQESLQAESHRMSNRLGNTTHISVADADGSAVSLTCTNGSNSGIAVPGTGILFNNILGEEDLNPGGFHQHPVGQRLTSMMAPTLVLQDEQPRLVLGSAGSNRIRSAILQVISGVLDFGLPIDEAVTAPRVHVEGKMVELEGGISPEVAEALAAAGYQVNAWKERNLFFGGAQAVLCEADGSLTGAGDPRRGGVAIVV